MLKRVLAVPALVLMLAGSAAAQSSQAEREAELRRTVPYSRMLRSDPGMTLQQYNDAVRELAKREVAQERRSVYAPPRPSYTTPSYSAPTYTPPPAYVPYTPPSRRYTPPEPTSGSSYDWRSGNSYSWTKQRSGETDVRGTNLNTGSMWNTTIKPDGSMRGMDSKMNPWTYDAGSKTYMNLGTGKMCVGEGAARTCF